MKFKVGDKVIVIHDMHKGCIGVVREVYDDPDDNHGFCYDVKFETPIDGCIWADGFNEDEIELIENNPPVTIKMTKEGYMKFHQECCDKMVSITKAKNSDYTGNTDDPFANFTQVEKAGICSTEVGFLTRMSDKMSRINSYVQKGDLLVKDESVLDTLLDLANYSILFAGYLKSKKDAQNS